MNARERLDASLAVLEKMTEPCAGSMVMWEGSEIWGLRFKAKPTPLSPYRAPSDWTHLPDTDQYRAPDGLVISGESIQAHGWERAWILADVARMAQP